MLFQSSVNEKKDIQNLILLTYGGSDPNGQLATIFILATINASQKGQGIRDD